MARLQCGICAHAERQHIEYALRAGEALKVIAEKYGSNTATLSRHHNRHMTATKDVRKMGPAPAAPIVPVDTADIADPLMARVADAVGKLTQAMDGEFAAGRVKAATDVSKEVRQWTELEARISGRMKDGGQGSYTDQRKQIIQIFSGKSERELRALLASGAEDVIEGEVIAG